jgi:serine/threonine protein kinase/tetratricopeptide (TPR) repeat protein
VNHDADASLDGRSLADRYRLIRPIGRGATAEVYLADDVRHNREVAVKIAFPARHSGHDIRRFLREIRVIARLTHPHILPLLDSGEVDGRPFYVMPLVPGQSLQDKLAATRPLPIDECVRISSEIADALSYAHAAGVVHRDIKPGNVLLSGPHALLADFGASHLIEVAGDELSLTQPGLSIGTPLYMSPEQAAGDPNIDGRSDIYSLACVAYEMLCGSPPFVGQSVTETIALRFTQTPAYIQWLRPEVPSHLDAAVLRGLEREPGDRFSTAGEFQAALATTSSAVDSPVRPESEPLPSVAVLPFAHLSEDPLDEHFSRGIADEIADALGRVRNLHVVARTSSLANATLDSHDIGRKLGVGAVLEGSVRRMGERVRVSVRLARSSDGRQVWSEQYTRGVTDVFAVQEEIARTVAHALEVRLLGQELAPIAVRFSANMEAHDLYTRARHAWNKRTEDQLSRSAQYFAEAIEMEPGFARAYAGLSDTLVTLALYGERKPGEVIPIAKESAAKALELDPTLADAHASLACALAVYDWQSKDAEEHFQRSIALNSHYPTAPHWYAVNLLAPHGRFDEALEMLERARRLDPLSASVASSPGVVMYAAGRFEESVRMHSGALESEPHFFPLHLFLGQALLQTGAHAEAIAAFEQALTLSGRSTEVLANLAHARAISDDSAGAKLMFDEMESRARSQYVSPYLFAQVCIGLGDRDAALAWLERASAERATEMIWLGVRPIFDAVRNDKRFQKILQTVGMATAEVRS